MTTTIIFFKSEIFFSFVHLETAIQFWNSLLPSLVFMTLPHAARIVQMASQQPKSLELSQELSNLHEPTTSTMGGWYA